MARTDQEPCPDTTTNRFAIPWGAPFLAINGMSRQELDWGGNVCVQTGWAWRGQRSEKLFRIGFEYLYGSDPQYEFVFYNQNRAGIGMWYDF